MESTSESVDDYLKAILDLGGTKEEAVTTNALAERLAIRTPSVTGMLKKLALRRPSLIRYEKHRGVRLTAAGKRRAWELVRHHRLLELFLHNVLKYSWDEVHEEAERLEHFISERFEDRVAAILGDPEIDPHGHRIPPKNEIGMPGEETVLAAWACGVPALISSVSDRSAPTLRELKRLGLVPGSTVTLQSGRSARTFLIQVQGREEPVRIDRDLASCIFVVSRPSVAAKG